MVPIAKKLGGHVLEQTATVDVHESQEGVVNDTERESTLLNHAEIPPEADLSQLSLEEILEVAGAQVQACGPFNTVCEEAGIYQLWTQDFVHYLGDYLWARHEEFVLQRSRSSQDEESGTLIIDVGAGDGLLTHYLQEYLEGSVAKQTKKSAKKIPMPKFVATDDGSWKIFAKAQVEKLNVHDTLKKYCPAPGQVPANGASSGKQQQVIILCSWMPMGQDWTDLFRQVKVDEYILIGEADDGSCGHNWKTWGNMAFWEEGGTENPDQELLRMPPHERDGYLRWDMTPSLSQYQFSRFDYKHSRSSATVSFRQRHN